MNSWKKEQHINIDAWISFELNVDRSVMLLSPAIYGDKKKNAAGIPRGTSWSVQLMG